MAPTICRDEENRCRHTIREVRKENSSFSVINYVGKKSTKLRKTTNNINNGDNSNIVISRKKVELFIRDTNSNSSSSSNNNSDTSSNISSDTINTESSLYLSDDNLNDDVNDRISSDNNICNNNNINNNSSDIDMIEQNSLDERPTSNSSSASSYTTDNDMNDNGCCKTEFFTNMKQQHNNSTDMCKKLSTLMNIGYSVKILNKNNTHQNHNAKDSIIHEKIHHNHNQNYNLKRQNYGLLEIAIRTVHLMKRNQLLQERLSQLQAETQAFITSVMANPENKEIREKMEQEQSNK